MKSKLLATGLLAAALSAVTASACILNVTVACPNDNTASGILVCAANPYYPTVCEKTDGLGLAILHLPDIGVWTVCVDPTTLPAGATLKDPCIIDTITSVDDVPPLEFVLGGDFCAPPPPPGLCWLTGGGTIGKNKTPDYSFGGVVYPGCSPKAADGGNWNVVDHQGGLHFQGQHIVVDDCLGVATKSPKVKVNIIDFHGDGIVSGIGGNPQATIAVTFVGRAVDLHDGGAGHDLLYIKVTDGTTTWLQIGNSPDLADMATISTGNLQIHTTSCGK